MLRKGSSLGLFFLISFFALPLVFAQTEEPASLDKDSSITVEGRLILGKLGEKEQLLLHAKDAETYIAKGELMDKLKDLLLNLGKDNLVTLTGKKDGSYNIACRTSYKYDYKGDRTIDSQCIRHYNLEVTQILESKQSAEKLPPLKRDAEEEKRAIAMALAQKPPTYGLTQIIQVQAKITDLNLRAPVKTMEISFSDKDKKKIKKSLLLNPRTSIAKKTKKDEEPMPLSVNSLKVGQKVFVVYSNDERVREAVAITIIK